MRSVIKTYNLILCEVATNNNKFWRGILYDDGTGASEYGRVGYDHQTCEYPTHDVVEQKMKQKLKKGYTPLKTVGASDTPTSIQSRDVDNHDLHRIAKSQLVKSSNPVLDQLIDRLVQSNVHRITSSTQITFNSTTGLFSTPLGIVTPDGIANARTLLVTLNEFVSKRDWTSTPMLRVTSDYLRIVPQAVGMRLNVQTLFPDVASIQKQSDVLDSLESSYQALQTQKPDATPTGKPVEQVFQVDLDVLQDPHEYTRLNAWFEKSKKDIHGYNNIHIKHIYVVNIHCMSNDFLSTDPIIKQVFHGSSMANCLSILKSGLKISPPSTAAVAGKLFGNGIYGALNSTKSLGYSLNRWGQGGVGDSAFLFICSFAMGRIYETTAYGCKKPNGYDSIWAKASYSGLKNDELIVFSEKRVRVNYLLECR